jgi:hypothetical protein
MNHRFDRWRVTGAFALLSALAAAGIAGATLDGYSHREYPLAYLGAEGVPGALVFDLFGFVLPGALACVLALALRARLSAQASWRARIGARLAMLSALGFALQGLLPLRADQPDAAVNALHATAWMLWWIAFVSGAALLASARLSRAASAASAASSLLVVALTVLPWTGAMVAIAPRLAFLVWLLWVAALPGWPPLRRD